MESETNDILEEVDPGLAIESTAARVTLSADKPGNVARFEIEDKETREVRTFDFDIRYYTDFDDPFRQVSGAYIFRPSPGEHDSKPFCQIEDAIVVPSSGTRNQFLITYVGLEEGPPSRTLNKAGWGIFIPSVLLLVLLVGKTCRERKAAKKK